MVRRRQLLVAAALGGSVATAGCFIPEPDGEELDDGEPDDDSEDDDQEDDEPDGDDDPEDEDPDEEPEPTPGEIGPLHDRFQSIVADLEWAETSYRAGVDAYREEHAAYRQLVESLQGEPEVTAVDVDRLRSHNDDLQAVFEGPLEPFAHLQSEIQTTGWVSEIADRVEIGDQDRVQESLDGLRGRLSTIAPTEFERSNDLSADPLTSQLVTAVDAPGVLKSRTIVEAARDDPTTAQPRPLFELRYDGAVSGARLAYSTDAATAVGEPSVGGTPGGAVFTEPTLAPPEPDLSAAVDIETAFEPVANPVDRVQEVWLVVNEFLPADADRVAGAVRYDVGLLPGTPVYIQEYDTESDAETAVDTLFEGPLSEPSPLVNPEIGDAIWQGIVYEGTSGPLYAALAQSGPLVVVAGPAREPLADREPAGEETPPWIQRLEWTFVADVEPAGD